MKPGSWRVHHEERETANSPTSTTELRTRFSGRARSFEAVYLQGGPVRHGMMPPDGDIQHDPRPGREAVASVVVVTSASRPDRWRMLNPGGGVGCRPVSKLAAVRARPPGRRSVPRNLPRRYRAAPQRRRLPRRPRRRSHPRPHHLRRLPQPLHARRHRGPPGRLRSDPDQRLATAAARLLRRGRARRRRDARRRRRRLQAGHRHRLRRHLGATTR